MVWGGLRGACWSELTLDHLDPFLVAADRPILLDAGRSIWTIREGKAVRMEGIPDSATVVEAFEARSAPVA